LTAVSAGIRLKRAAAPLCAQGARSEASEQRPGLLFIGSMPTTRDRPPLPAAVVSRVTREAGELGSVKFAKIKLRFNGPDPILWL